MAPVADPSSIALQLIPFGAGSLAGVVAKTLTAPLERIKTVLQIEGMTAAASNGSRLEAAVKAQQPGKNHIVRVAQQIYARDGLRGLWYGNNANCLRVVPVYALKFGTNDLLKSLVTVPGQRASFAQLIASGTLAGLVQLVITYPLETVRTRLTIGALHGAEYRGIMHCFYSTTKHEGLRGLYKGLTPSLWSGAPYVGLQMTCFEMLMRQAEALSGLTANVTANVFHDKTFQAVACGAVASLVAQTLTYPGDTIRKRMQTDGIRGRTMMYRGMLDCTNSIVRKEGFQVLFAGLSANIMRGVPGAGIQFGAFTYFKDKLSLLVGL